MKKMLQDAVVLFVITLCAGLVLGFFYQLTKAPIQRQKEIAREKACKEVFSDAVSFDALNGDTVEEATNKLAQGGFEAQSISEDTVKAMDSSGNALGYVLTITSGEGYGGDITFTMGVKMDGTLNGISILTIKETPGLGMKAEDVLKPQFSDKKAEQFEYTKTGSMAENQIDAISGATITTNAFVNGVNAGLYYFEQELSQGGE